MLGKDRTGGRTGYGTAGTHTPERPPQDSTGQADTDARPLRPARLSPSPRSRTVLASPLTRRASPHDARPGTPGGHTLAPLVDRGVMRLSHPMPRQTPVFPKNR